MLYLKTDEEVGLLKESNMLVSRTLAEVAKFIKPGVTTLYLDKIAESFIRMQESVRILTIRARQKTRANTGP